VKELANGFDPADNSFTTNPPAEARILARIRKCLAVANHAGTPETEARAALRMGSKLMSQYNVTQAEAFEDINNEDRAQHGGHSIVAITATDDGKVKNYAFTAELASAICVFFDCKVYSTELWFSHEWTFYGIASNTAAAAIAFEMTYNLIFHWSMPKKGASPNNSYSRGVADGLYDLALEEKREEMRKTRENEAEALAKLIGEEQSARQIEIDRLNFQVSTFGLILCLAAEAKTSLHRYQLLKWKTAFKSNAPRPASMSCWIKKPIMHLETKETMSRQSTRTLSSSLISRKRMKALLIHMRTLKQSWKGSSNIKSLV
jgi:hypothetical protein